MLILAASFGGSCLGAETDGQPPEKDEQSDDRLLEQEPSEVLGGVPDTWCSQSANGGPDECACDGEEKCEQLQQACEKVSWHYVGGPYSGVCRSQ